jgi:SlyX protein
VIGTWNAPGATDCLSGSAIMRDTATMTERLDAIEEKLAHLEQAVAELNDVVIRQQKELDRALDRNQRLMDKLAALESESAPSATAHEKPPHY